MLGWIALVVLIGAGLYLVVRLVRSWTAARRRYGDPGAGPPRDGPA